MKLKFITAITLFSSILIFSQTKNWNEFELDSIISFKAPSENLYELDTIFKEVKIYQLFTTIDNGTFIAQKSKITDRRKPFTKIKDLNKYYDNFIKGTIEKSGFKLVNKKENRINELHGYKFVLANSEGNKIYAAQVFIIDGYIYNFIYMNEVDFIEKDNELFLKYIKPNSKTKIIQF